MRNKFDEQLKLLNEELNEMGALCESAIANSAKALLTGDKSLAEHAISIDSEIDQQEREIESLCLKLLLQQQPVARDLRQISSALKMITDMERIGDQAADIAEIISLANLKASNKTMHIGEMAKATIKMVMDSVDAFVKRDLDAAQAVVAYDDVVDQLFDTVKNELIELIASGHADAEYAVDLLMIAKYFERIGDHAVNIMEAAQSVAVDKIQLSPDAKAEMDIIKEAVMNITKMTVEAFDSYHYNLAKKIEPLEEVIDDMVVSAKNHHVERLKLGQCNMESGMIFVDLLTNLERIADQCSNIALLILSQRDKSILGNHHNYLNELHKGGDVTYDKELEWQKEQYLEKFRRIGQKA